MMSDQNTLTQNTLATTDTGRIRIGAAFRLAGAAAPLPSVAAAAPDMADPGRIRIGAAFRLVAKG